MAAVWTWSSIIEALGNTREVADSLEQAVSTVSGWKERGIPSAHWLGLVRLAEVKERSDISLETFAELAARKTTEEARA